MPRGGGGGHGPRPGPTDGICRGWGRPAGAPKTLFAGPACASSVTKAHPYGYGDNGIYAGDGVMIDEPHTYDPPSRPGGQWTQVYARTDPVGQHVLGYYRVVVPAPSPAPVPSPSVPPPTAWPTGFPGAPD